MQEFAPQLGALLRHLETEQIEHVVPSESPTDHPQDSAPARTVTIIVAADTLAELPTALNEFCQRNHMQLVHHCHAQGDQLFMVSWLDSKQRPEFATLRVQKAHRGSSH